MFLPAIQNFKWLQVKDPDLESSTVYENWLATNSVIDVSEGPRFTFLLHCYLLWMLRWACYLMNYRFKDLAELIQILLHLYNMRGFLPLTFTMEEVHHHFLLTSGCQSFWLNFERPIKLCKCVFSNNSITKVFILTFVEWYILILGLDFPVYHTAFDSYDWMTKFGDPLFHRHVAGQLLHFLYTFMCQICPYKYTLRLNLRSLCFLSCWNMGSYSPPPGWWFNPPFQLLFLCGSVKGINLPRFSFHFFFFMCNSYNTIFLFTFCLVELRIEKPSLGTKVKLLSNGVLSLHVILLNVR